MGNRTSEPSTVSDMRPGNRGRPPGYTRIMKKTDIGFVMAFAASLLMLPGCANVTSLRPVGRTAESDACNDISGTWSGGGGRQLQIRCTDAGNAVFAVTEWKDDEERFVLESGGGVLRSLEDLIVFNVVVGEEAENTTRDYMFLVLRAGDDRLIGWLPDVDAFAELITGGRLEGTIEDGDYTSGVRLTGDGEKIADVLEADDPAALFDWSHPAVVLVRVGD